MKKRQISFLAIFLIALWLSVCFLGGYFMKRINFLEKQNFEQELKILAAEKKIPQIAKFMQVVDLLTESTKGKLTARQIVEISKIIVTYCRLYEDIGLSENIIFALIERESQFNPDAISSTKAMGIAQVMKITAEEHLPDMGFKTWSNEIIMDPVINIEIGIRELVKLRKFWLAEGIDSWSICFTSYYWGIRNTMILITEKRRAQLPSMEYGVGVLKLAEKWKERGL